jgi:hypothetical protein
VTAETGKQRTEPERIREAQRATRCKHVKYNGEVCGCPALRGRDFCHYHQDAHDPQQVAVPFVEDAAALQVAIMRVLRAIETDAIEYKKATAELYALQLASNNVSRLRDEIPVEPDPDRESAFDYFMRILDPPVGKRADVIRELHRLLALL